MHDNSPENEEFLANVFACGSRHRAGGLAGQCKGGLSVDIQNKYVACIGPLRIMSALGRDLVLLVPAVIIASDLVFRTGV